MTKKTERDWKVKVGKINPKKEDIYPKNRNKCGAEYCACTGACFEEVFNENIDTDEDAD